MGSFGERLQREREMRGITLEEIAEATKIGTRSLRALEEQDFDKLPGGIFNKGFVRAYSKYLGIDEDQAVADYVTAVNDAQPTGKLKLVEVPKTFAEEAEAETSEPVQVPWGLLILIALVVVVGFSAKSYYAKHGWAKLKRQAIPATAQAAPAQQPTVTTEPAAATSAPDPIAQNPQRSQSPSTETADSFVVKVRATEDSWVWIKADGKVVSSGMMSANSDRVVRASKEVVLKTGNAGGIELSHNDKLLPPIGPQNQVRTVTLTAQGIQP